MAFDFDAWTNDLGADLTPEERGVLSGIFKKDPKRLEALEKNQLRLTDYSRAMTKLKADEAANAKKLEDAEADLENQRGTLTTWKTGAEGKLSATEKARDDAETKLFETQRRMRKLAEEAGIDPETLELGDVTPPRKKEEPPEPVFDTKAIEELTNKTSASLIGNVRFNALMMKLNNEHRTLFGTDMPDPDVITDMVLEQMKKGNQKVDVTAIWEEKYGVKAKRDALATVAFNKRVDEEVEAKYRKRLEDEALGTAPREDGRVGSPILKRFGGKEHKSEEQQHGDTRTRHNGETGADAAKRAFNSGKYRQEAAQLARQRLAG